MFSGGRRSQADARRIPLFPVSVEDGSRQLTRLDPLLQRYNGERPNARVSVRRRNRLDMPEGHNPVLRARHLVANGARGHPLHAREVVVEGYRPQAHRDPSGIIMHLAYYSDDGDIMQRA